jgi:hypothetical protein
MDIALHHSGRTAFVNQRDSARGRGMVIGCCQDAYIRKIPADFGCNCADLL